MGSWALLPLYLASAQTLTDVPHAAHPLLPSSEAPSISAMTPPPAGYQVVVERRIIIRIPARSTTLTTFDGGPTRADPRALDDASVVWKERDGPRCVLARGIWGVQGAQKNSVDMILRDRQRLRARLNRGCRALDFYSGFYFRPTADQRLCADRDRILARTGAECTIDSFRLLVPRPAK